MTRARDLADSADKDISGTLTLDDIVLSNDLTVADNGKIILGASSDLQLFHDGSNSFINNTVTGALSLKSDDINLMSSASETMATFVENGAVTLYHDNSAKIATTSTGCDITGALTSDGVTVQSNNNLDILDADNHVSGRLRNVSGSNNALAIEADPDNSASDTFINFKIDASEKMRLTTTGLGIGTSSVAAGFLVEGTGDARFGDTAGDDAVELGWSQGGGYAFVQAYDRNASAQRDLLLNGVVKVLAIGDVRFSGNSHTPYIQLANSGRVASNPGYSFHNDTNSGMYQPSGAADTIAFSTAGTERLRIGSNGDTTLYQNVRAGTTGAGNGVVDLNGRTGSFAIDYIDSGGTRRMGVVAGSGNLQNANNSYGSTSDQKLKENITDASSQWDDIKALRVRKYSMKADALNAPNQLGVIAQELETSGMSGLVYETSDKDSNNNDLGTTTKSVKYSILYMKAVKALQEAMDRIETLEAKVTALENA